MSLSLVELLEPPQLQELADRAFPRGEDYARRGRVSNLIQAEEAAQASVRGAGGLYQVELRCSNGRVLHQCSCPVGQQGIFCKHCVAVALVLERPPSARSALTRRAEGASSPKASARSAEAGRAGQRPETEWTHFETDAELGRWLKVNGLDHVRKLGADAVAPFLVLDPQGRLERVLGHHRLTDFATVQSLLRFGYALAFAPAVQQQLPPAAWVFLQAERERLREARDCLPKQRVAPADPRAAQVHQALVTLRESFPAEVPVVLETALKPAELQFSAALPGFVFHDDRRWVPDSRLGYGLILPEVRLTLSGPRASAICSCGAEKCPHALKAVDTALAWLQLPTRGERAHALEELARAPWERTLRALEGVLEEGSRASSSSLISWRLQIIDGYGVDVLPYLHRVSGRGTSSGARIAPSRLLEQLRSALTPGDVRIAELCASTQGKATQSLLLALAEHPRVFLDEAPEQSVRVERVKVGLVAEERPTSVVLRAGVDGTPLPAALRDQALKARSDDALFLWDGGARRLSVLEVSVELRSVLSTLVQYGDEFPPESYGALVEKLSRVSTRLPVAMPRSVMGEAVVPRADGVLQLQLQSDRSVRLQVRTRPLPEGGSYLPGEGVRDVYGRRGTKSLHAVRDFPAELSASRALLLQLPVEDAERESEFDFLFATPQGALGLLAAYPALDPKPALEWAGEPLKLVGSAAPTSLKVTLERRRDWFGALGGLSVKGERVELAVLLDAARRKEKFVQLSGHSYLEIEEVLRRHLERLADHTFVSKHGVELGPSAAEALDALAESGANISSDAAWRSLMERIFAAKELKPRVPRGLQAELRDYQAEGFRWMTRLASWGAGAVLADDMGLGKTVQALAVLLDRSRLGPALVLAPTSVGFNWIDEAARFAPSLRLRHYADSTDRGGTLERLGPKDVLVLSYGLLTRDLERLKAVRFSTVIFDEAQALKNSATHRTRAARELQADFKVALSGTPVENHLGELWSLYRVVFPGLLGSWEAFRARFANPIEKKLDPTAAPALARVLQPFLLRRTKSQVETELPPRTEIRVPVVLSAEEWQLYEDARLALLSDLETPTRKLKEQERRIEVLAALTRLRLLASHPRLYDSSSKLESAKLQRLLELIDELTAEGHRALVFSQFTSHLALVREVLDARKIPYVYLDGSTPRVERERRVRSFQEGDAPLFLISLKAGGTGLNLTGADNVIHLDPWWNPAVEDQASDRAHRIGQRKPVTVYRLIARGTIEEQILQLHADKRALVNDLLEGKDQAGRLGTAELLALLTGNVAPSTDLIGAGQTRH